jgi:hypothetical protein
MPIALAGEINLHRFLFLIARLRQSRQCFAQLLLQLWILQLDIRNIVEQNRFDIGAAAGDQIDLECFNRVPVRPDDIVFGTVARSGWAIVPGMDPRVAKRA